MDAGDYLADITHIGTTKAEIGLGNGLANLSSQGVHITGEQFRWVVLETTLTEGDYLVVDPGGSLRDGMSVRAILASEVILE